MFRTKGFLGTLVLGAAMIAPVLASGCAAHTRYYDEYHADYHTWNSGEIGAYRVWIGERHYEYRDYNRLSGNNNANTGTGVTITPADTNFRRIAF
jgi:hypothetical protein